MVVQCPSCATKFRLDETKIGAKGAKVRCSKCSHSFVVKRAEATPSAMVAAPPPQAFDDQSTVPMELQVVKAHANMTLAGMEAAATVPGAAANLPVRLDLDPPRPQPRSTDPTVPGVGDTDPAASAVHGADLALPELPDLPPGPSSEAPVHHPVHEAQTAVYMVPDTIRAAAAAKDRELQAAAGALSSQDLAGIDLDSDAEAATNVISPETLAAMRETASAESPSAADIPMADADLLDPGDFDLVSNTEAESPAALITQPDAPARVSTPEESEDPFADRSFAPSGGLTAEGVFIPPEPSASESSFDGGGSGPKAVGRIRPAVAGGSPLVAPATALPAPAPTVQAPRPRRPWSIGVKIATTLMALLLLALGVLLFISGGRLDTLIAKLQHGRLPEWSVSVQRLGYRDVVPVSMRSVLYPTKGGRQVLVFVGEAENRAAEPRQSIDVVAELRDRAGRLTAMARAPLGVVLGPVELYELVDVDSLTAAYQDAMSKRPVAPLPSRAIAKFSVVLLNPPAGLSELSHVVHLESGQAPPPPIEAPPPPDPLPSDETTLKGKKAKKAKKARRKAKVNEEG